MFANSNDVSNEVVFLKRRVYHLYVFFVNACVGTRERQMKFKSRVTNGTAINCTRNSSVRLMKEYLSQNTINT